MTKIRPDSRLLSASAYVRQGGFLADIGTDHAYLPVYLCQEGIISRALACDIAEGPCLRAQKTIKSAGLTEQITVVQTDGLQGLEDKGISDITICGMGGELIASILEKAPFIRDKNIRLILLPMTKVAALRLFLSQNGFLIEGETLSSVSGKIYTCICASFEGTPYTLSPFALEFGAHLPASPSPLLKTLMEKKKRDLKKRIEGAKKAGKDGEKDTLLLNEIERYLYDCR